MTDMTRAKGLYKSRVMCDVFAKISGNGKVNTRENVLPACVNVKKHRSVSGVLPSTHHVTKTILNHCASLARRVQCLCVCAEALAN